MMVDDETFPAIDRARFHGYLTKLKEAKMIRVHKYIQWVLTRNNKIPLCLCSIIIPQLQIHSTPDSNSLLDVLCHLSMILININTSFYCLT